MEFKDLEHELWSLDNNYAKYLSDTNGYFANPIVQALLLIAKILLYRENIKNE